MNLKRFRQLLSAGDQPVNVEILAVEPVIYLIRISTGVENYGGEAAAQSTLLKNPKGANWVFRSLTEAKAKLADLGVRRATLVQQSAYGEMVGSAGSQADAELRLPITLREDY